jgi:hypothetical protein
MIFEGSEKVPNSSRKTLRSISDYLIAIITFIALNVVVFHTELYHHVSLVNSYAGNVYGRMSVLKEVEKKRGAKVIALVGDSVTEDGLGAREISQNIGKPVVNLALPGASPNEWLYFLRSIDPKRNRFDAIVLTIAPHNMRQRPHEDGVQTLMPVASLGLMLRYAWEFHDPAEKFEHGYATFDRIFGYRKDLAHLFMSPGRLLTAREDKKNQISKLKNWPGETFNVCRTIIDSETKEVVRWGAIRDREVRRLSENALNRTFELNRRAVVSGILEPLTEIINYYNNSTTNIVIISIPFGLYHEIRQRAPAMRDYFWSIEEFDRRPHVYHINGIHEPLFKDCQNFYDFRHLNSRGRKLLSDFLSEELKTLLKN